MFWRAIVLFSISILSLQGSVLVPFDSTFSYLKGTSEVSLPDTTAWRSPDFPVTSWLQGNEPFYYENSPGSSTAYTGNTVLNDMNGSYTCIFMRRSFTVTNVNDIAGLQLTGMCDDGFIAWVNGHEVGRFNMPDGEIAYNGTASGALTEPVPWYTNTLTDVSGFLRQGQNVFAVQAFNNTLSGSSDFYISASLSAILNPAPPSVIFLAPTNWDTVTSLLSAEVGFSTKVTGLKASDLLINGSPATNVVATTPTQYLFYFPQPTNGLVTFSWSPNQKIHDLTSASNAFVGSSWACMLDTTLENQSVIISEFMANNSGKQSNSRFDELGNHPDWIELYNRKSSAISLTGWSLSDDETIPAKWVFPATIIPGQSFMVIYASGRDTNVSGQLHSSFKLSSSPSYLALYDTGGNAVSKFAPYPQQYTDVSYGRDRLDPSITGYFTNSTPGAANSSQGNGFGPEVKFSRLGGTFLTNFNLTLTTSDTNFDIRYVLVTANVSSGSTALVDIPTTNSLLYSGPIAISGPVEVRARTFPKIASVFPGPPHTECFLRLSTASAAFTSDVPIIIIHNLSGGSIPTDVKQSVIAMTFEPVNGVASMTNPPTLVTRASIHIRGSSSSGEPQSPLAFEAWDEYNEGQNVPFVGLPSQSDWVFYGQDGYDTSYLHNPLAHQFERDLGHYSPRTRFAEVFLNIAGGPIIYNYPIGGNYFGLYTIEEKIKRDNNRVNITKLEPQITTAPDITGGYMFKVDRSDWTEATFWDDNAQTSIVFVDPGGLEMYDPARSAQYNYITTYFSQFGAALWGNSYTNPTTGYAAYIDVDSWLDHHIVNALAFNVDGLRLSSFMYKDRNEKLCLGPVWDFDRSMGSSDGRPFNPRLWRVQAGGDQGTDYFGNPDLLGVRWWQRLFTDPDFWQKWIDRYTVLRRDAFSTDHIFTMIDGYTNQIRISRPRQSQRWSNTAPRNGSSSITGYGYTFNGTYPSEIAFLKRWFADRLNFLDTNFLAPPVFSIPATNITPGTTLTITAPTIEPNTTIYYTLDGTDPRLPGGAFSPAAKSGTSPLALTLTNNVRVFVRNWNAAHKNATGGTVGGNPPISSSWSGPMVATFVVARPTLAVTELMYSPSAYGTNDAENYEYIELKNTGTLALNLVGMHFTNGIEYVFTATNGAPTLAPGAYLILAANPTALLQRFPKLGNSLIVGPYTGHFNNAGERVTLLGAMEETILDFTYDNSWYPTTSDDGFSLVVQDETGSTDLSSAAAWRASSNLGGSPGIADPAPANIPQVVINELLSHGGSSEVDYVELFNPGDTDANIGGWYLTDNNSSPTKYTIPSGTVIPPGGYAVFSEKQFNTGAAGSFSFSAQGEEVYLFSGDGATLTGYRHGFKFGAQVKSATFGRHVTSDGLEHFVTQKRPTPGSANAGPKVGPIVINEILYAPPAFGLSADNLDEYIELRNISTEPVGLFDTLHPTNTWSISGGIEYTFPTNTVMAPGGYLLVVHFDPAQDPVMLNWFQSRYGVSTNVPLYGPYSGNLNNTGEKVSLYMPDTPTSAGLAPQVLVEEVNYSNVAPWPTGADGTGYSIQRIASAAFANDPANWQAAAPSSGTLNAGAWSVSSAHDGLPDEWKLAYGLDPLSSEGDNGPAGDPDGDGMNNLQEYVAGTSPIDARDYLAFDEAWATNDVFTLRFQTHAGRSYVIEQLEDLGLTNQWTSAFSTNATADAPCVLTVPTSATNRFYRIKVTKP